MPTAGLIDNDAPDAPDTAVLAVSHRYGGDSAFVLAGGGNTSSKSENCLWVKASGHALATIGADGFVALDRPALDAMLHDTWPADSKQREALFLERVMAARRQPERGQRPSVEALLHHLLPGKLVVHTHPGLVNAVTCCVDGERLTRAWFGDDVLWQPYVDPGLTLAQALQSSLAAASNRPSAIFLENHGLIVADDSAEGIERTSTRITQTIADALATRPAVAASLPLEFRLTDIAKKLQARRPGLHCVTDTSPAAAWLAGTDAGTAAALAGPLTPDQIVYCRSVPLWLQSTGGNSTNWEIIRDAWAGYVERYGVEPWVIVVADVGVIALRDTEKMAAITLAVFLDAAAVGRDAEHLGGVRPLSVEHRQFIEQWEVEAYRRSVAAKG